MGSDSASPRPLLCLPLLWDLFVPCSRYCPPPQPHCPPALLFHQHAAYLRACALAPASAKNTFLPRYPRDLLHSHHLSAPASLLSRTASPSPPSPPYFSSQQSLAAGLRVCEEACMHVRVYVFCLFSLDCSSKQARTLDYSLLIPCLRPCLPFNKYLLN